jgi:hypothetical protein
MKKPFQDYSHQKMFEVYCGVSGAGKTTFWLKRVKTEQAWMKFIFDHQDGEFSHRFKIPAVSTPDDLLEKTGKGGYIIFDHREMFGTDKEKAFDWFCSYVFTASGAVGGRKIFACDELHKLVGQRKIPKEFLAICDEGRRRKLDILAICHGTNLLHNSIRNEITKIYTFRQTDEQAIDYLKQNGIDPEKIRNLSNGCWISRANTGEICSGGKAFQPKPA